MACSPSLGVGLKLNQYYLGMPTSSVPTLPQLILKAGQIVGEDFVAGLGVQASFCSLKSTFTCHGSLLAPG